MQKLVRRVFLFSPASRKVSRRRKVKRKEIAHHGGSVLTKRAGGEGQKGTAVRVCDLKRERTRAGSVERLSTNPVEGVLGFWICFVLNQRGDPRLWQGRTSGALALTKVPMQTRGWRPTGALPSDIGRQRARLSGLAPSAERRRGSCGGRRRSRSVSRATPTIGIEAARGEKPRHSKAGSAARTVRPP